MGINYEMQFLNIRDSRKHDAGKKLTNKAFTKKLDYCILNIYWLKMLIDTTS